MISERVCVCVFAKPPRAGQVKTRLALSVGPVYAAALAEAFLLDTLSTLRSLAWINPVIASTEPFCPPNEIDCWLQGEGDLGQRIERILTRALATGGRAIALGADSPGLPQHLLEHARQTLTTHDAVLGPCDDGGFYLLGLKRCPAGCLNPIRWSTCYACTDTRASLESTGMTVALLDPWFDVDTESDLDRLRRELWAGRIVAPRTAAVLAGLPQCRS